MLCIDSSGLCLAATGDFKEESAGLYHNLIHMASQLSAASATHGDTAPPVIRIETDDGCTLVKTCDGHTVAVHIPARSPPFTGGADTAAPPDEDDDMLITTAATSQDNSDQ
jgi:Ragulator complex protein LAMTOR5